MKLSPRKYFGVLEKSLLANLMKADRFSCARCKQVIPSSAAERAYMEALTSDRLPIKGQWYHCPGCGEYTAIIRRRTRSKEVKNETV
jgi:predicted RNA-binding Zn-ribbon protein involved in translation (DUF1610 family)